MPARNLRALASLTFSAVLAPLIAPVVLSGCWAGEEEPVSLLDRHSPAYTEPKGTRHAGDFLPLAAGGVDLLSGSMKVTVGLTARGSSQGMPVTMDTTLVAEAALSADVRTLAARAIQLARGAVEAIPQETATRTFGGGLLGEAETETLTAYYQKTLDAVNLLAVSGPDGVLVESPRPLHLKVPLVVGEYWDSHAADIPDLSGDGVTLNMQARSRTFVVGKETVGAGESAREAVRLEQVTELSGTALAEDGTTMNLGGHLQVALHFAEGVGQVRQKMVGRITMSGSTTQGADRINMKMTMDMDGDMERVSLTMKKSGPGPEGVPPASSPVGGQSLVPAVADEPAPARPGAVETAAKAFAGAALRGILSVAP
jgi:hypothetical protein